MENKQNAEFAKQELEKEEISNRDVQIFWKHDFKLLKKAPRILCAKAFEISNNNLKNCIAPSKAATMLFMCGLRSYIGLALAEVIIEDYQEQVKKNPIMYIIELENSKTFFDTWILRDYLENALKITNSKEDCIKYLKGIFTPIYKREKKHLIKSEECY